MTNTSLHIENIEINKTCKAPTLKNVYSDENA